jgi:hypothetical protein
MKAYLLTAVAVTENVSSTPPSRDVLPLRQGRRRAVELFAERSSVGIHVHGGHRERIG